MKYVLSSISLCLLFACGDSSPSQPDPVCGDGIVQGTEACDDGNTVDGDDCNNACKVPGCGDGVVNFNEACDDGNDVNGDGCDINCTQSFCGNGIKGPGEECDDGNTVSGDGCDANCTTTMCGNGVVSAGEVCDDGNAVEGDGCDTNCKASACGNGVKGGSEGCDDGNTTTGDGCSATCGVETLEVEPNDDGTPSIGASGINGNDFATAAPDTNGAITGSTTIVAALVPAGDEDIFKLTNSESFPMHVKINTWNLDTGFGVGMACGSSIDTGIQIKSAAGAVLASNNDRNSTSDKCAGLAIDLFPGDTVYIQVVENGDNAVVPKYALDVIIEPSICGDGHVGPGEDCDDMNTAAGDGCSPTCQIENSLAEIEPNEDGTPQTGGGTTTGNDFGTAKPLDNGMITESVTIVGSLSPAGDEDVYAFTNIRPNIVTVSFDTWGLIQGLGLNVPCGTLVDTVLHIRDASGTSLATNNDRNSSDWCSAIPPFTLMPGQTRFVHVLDWGDNTVVQKYALVIKYSDVLCGDNSVGFGEECDDGNTMAGDGCDANCQLEPFCGDAILQTAEQCDDGNMNAGDGCSATCQVEGAVTEMEPNEDGSISTGGGTTGNDFATANADANGAFTGSVRIAARIRAAGDEDVFAFKNPSTTQAVAARFDIWNNAPGFGIGVSCGSSAAVDSYLHIRNAAGTSLASNDDRVSSTDRCAALTFGILPGQTVYAHVFHDGDSTEEASYTLEVVYTPVPCGDAITGPGEQCDDGNASNGDGCSSSCQLENTMNEIEPNEDGTPQTGGGGTTTYDGNDFAIANPNANGAITSSKRIFAAISPSGDEDIFAISNPTTGAMLAKFDVWSMAAGKGYGVPCGTTIDTGMNLRDAAGVRLANNDDRNASSDWCSTLSYTLSPGQTVYVQVMDHGDSDQIASYLLDVQLTPVVCGDGVIGPQEQCDDGNATSGDGCSSTCQIEIVCGNGVLQTGEACDDSNTANGDGCSSTCTIENQVSEVEPNNTTADAMNNTLQITGNVVVAGAITPSGDVDRFRVDVATATVVRFESFVGWGDCSTATIDLRLFDSAGNTITTDLEGTGIKECGAITKFLAAGTYYVQVEERGNNATIAAYQLQVAFQTDGGAETEPNDTTAQASVNLLNERFVLGDHTNVMDADVYAITVPPKAHIRAEIVEGSTAETCESGGIDARISLFDDTGALIAEDNDSGRGLCSLIDGTGSSPLDPAARNASSTTKTFYLMVRSSAFAPPSNAMFAYRLQLTLR